MSYWSDEAVQKRAAEQEEMRLQWKFRGCTTSQLEMRLENMAMSKQGQKDIELELVRRGATYIKRSYYDRPSKFFGSDGSELIIAAAGEGAGRTIYDWDNIVAAENAYIDEVLAKPIPKVSSADMATFLDNQKAIVRRVIPGLISMDSISGVQPMIKHIDHLALLSNLKPFDDYALSNEALDKMVAADKDLQPVTGHFWSDRISQQSIGRGLRPTVKYGDLHIRDYMGMIHTTAVPNTNSAISALMNVIQESEVTQASFFNTESTFNPLTGDFFSKVDTSKWIAECKATMGKYLDDAPWNMKYQYYADNIWDDSVSKMYPNTTQSIDMSLGTKCMEIPITPIMTGTEVTSASTLHFEELWKDYMMEAAKASSRALYYSNPFKVITAKAPEYKAIRVMSATSEGIYPERLSSKELRSGWELDQMISISMPTSDEKSAFAGLVDEDELDDKPAQKQTMKIAKNRKQSATGKAYAVFDPDMAISWAKWADKGTVKKTKEEDVAETLKLLGIGAKE